MAAPSIQSGAAAAAAAAERWRPLRSRVGGAGQGLQKFDPVGRSSCSSSSRELAAATIKSGHRGGGLSVGNNSLWKRASPPFAVRWLQNRSATGDTVKHMRIVDSSMQNRLLGQGAFCKLLSTCLQTRPPHSICAPSLPPHPTPPRSPTPSPAAPPHHLAHPPSPTLAPQEVLPAGKCEVEGQ